MPPAIEIEIQAERQRLPYPDGQVVAWGSCRKRVFDRGEEISIGLGGSGDAETVFASVSARARFSCRAFWNHALRVELLLNVGVIPLAVEFDIGRYQAAGCLRRGCCGYRTQIRAIVAWAASLDLRKQEPLVQIGHHDPFQPMPRRKWFLPVTMQATRKERADRSLRRARCVHVHASPSAAFSASAMRAAPRLANCAVDLLGVQTPRQTTPPFGDV